jgi:AP2 domain
MMVVDGFVGRKFNRWLVEERAEDYIYPSTGRIGVRYKCLCDCGRVKSVHKSHLLNGSSQSCGCLSKEISTTHGLSGTREYAAWSCMLDRCSKGGKGNEVYVQKGIKVCDRWKNSVTNFLEDMGNCPEGYEIDRIDTEGDYDPSNCRWADESTQAQNRGKFKNNTSGTTGVTLVKNYLKSGKENFYWRAIKVHNKTTTRKNFSVNKLGFDEAKRLAEDYLKNRYIDNTK